MSDCDRERVIALAFAALLAARVMLDLIGANTRLADIFFGVGLLAVGLFGLRLRASATYRPRQRWNGFQLPFVLTIALVLAVVRIGFPGDFKAAIDVLLAVSAALCLAAVARPSLV